MKFKWSGLVAIVVIITPAIAFGQNSNSSTTVRPRTTASPSSTNRSIDVEKSVETPAPAKAPQPEAKPRATTTRPATAETPGSQTVVAAFNSLLNGIRKADVNSVSGVYWNSPRLLLFNNNGTVTKGWDQMRRNRESSYKEVKDVKLDVRDVSITMIGRDGAVVSAQWTQSQTFRGTPETATGRMTLVFRRVGKEWKAIHLHTSPDRPDPSRVMPSEQTTSTPANPQNN